MAPRPQVRGTGVYIGTMRYRYPPVYIFCESPCQAQSAQSSFQGPEVFPALIYD